MSNLLNCEDILGVATGIFRSVCYNQRKNDRFKVTYSYPESQLGTLLNNTLVNSLVTATGKNGFFLESFELPREGIIYNLQTGEEIYAGLDDTTSAYTIKVDGTIVASAFTGQINYTHTDSNGFQYVNIYDIGSNQLLVQVFDASNNFVNTLIIDGNSGIIQMG